MKAWRIEVFGISAVYVAPTRAKARYYVADQAFDAGYGDSIGDALLRMTCRRAPEHDSPRAVGGGTGFVMGTDA